MSLDLSIPAWSSACYNGCHRGVKERHSAFQSCICLLPHYMSAVWQEKVGAMGQGSCAANVGADVAQKEEMGIYLAVCKPACAYRPELQPGGLSR